MKVWMYCIRTCDLYRSPSLSKDYQLHALTNKKKLAKKFKETRNMKLYREIIKEMSKEEYAELAKEERECVLEEIELLTEASFGKVKEIPFVLTFSESMEIDDECNGSMYAMILTKQAVNPLYFNRSIQKILRELNYYEYYCMSREIGLEEIYDSEKMSDSVAFYKANYYLDELGFFIEVYGHLLKI